MKLLHSVMFNEINIRDLTDFFSDLLERVPWDGALEGSEKPDCQGSFLLRSRTVHPSEQEVKQKCQEACMYEQAAPGNA